MKLYSLEDLGDKDLGDKDLGDKDLGACIEAVRTSGEPVELWLDNLSGIDLFLVAYFRFGRRFGPPDFPQQGAEDYRRLLGIDEGALAVWDFDYYLLALTCDPNRPDGPVLLLHRQAGS